MTNAKHERPRSSLELLGLMLAAGLVSSLVAVFLADALARRREVLPAGRVPDQIAPGHGSA